MDRHDCRRAHNGCMAASGHPYHSDAQNAGRLIADAGYALRRNTALARVWHHAWLATADRVQHRHDLSRRGDSDDKAQEYPCRLEAGVGWFHLRTTNAFSRSGLELIYRQRYAVSNVPIKNWFFALNWKTIFPQADIVQSNARRMVCFATISSSFALTMRAATFDLCFVTVGWF
jgi:hypothetical protein